MAGSLTLHYYEEDIYFTDPAKRFVKVGIARAIKPGSTVVIEQANAFDDHRIVLEDTELETILALRPKTRVHIEEVGLGIVAKGVIMSPAQQIETTGEGEITLTLPNLTEECRWIRTGMGYRDQQELRQVIANIGALTTYDRSYPDYSHVNSKGVPGYDDFGRMVTVVYPGRETGWSAAYVDEGDGFQLTTAPVDWSGGAGGGSRYATYDGNTLKADPAHPANWDAGGVGRPQHFDLAHDMSFQWQVVDTHQYQATGLAESPQVAVGAINFGFSIANGTWQAIWNGVPIGGPTLLPGGGNVFFSIAYNAAAGAIWYFINNVKVYSLVGVAAPPLVPMAVFGSTNAEVTNAIVFRVAPPSQMWWKVAQDNRTQLGAALDLATDTDLYLRLGRAASGEPQRVLELGAFGQKSGLRLIDGSGGDARAMEANDAIRIVRSIHQDGPDATNLINLITPLGSGTGETQVSVEHLWRILYDPSPDSSPNYGRYPGGPNAAAGIVFAEYDERYPIKRRATDAGGYEYYMTSDASIAAWNEMQGGSPDPTYTYQQDAGVSNLAYQELTERGLYAATIGKFRKNDQPHLALTLTTTGRGLPCRAAELVTVDYTGYGSQNGISFTRLKVKDDFYVMKIVRTYDEDTTDEWTLSNLGRYAPSDATAASDQARTTAALMNVTTTALSVSMLGVTFRELDAGDATADHSIIYPIKILPSCFEVQAAFFRVDFYPYRQTVTTAKDGLHHHTVAFTIPGHHHGPMTGLIADAAQIGGTPLHYHKIKVDNHNSNYTIPSVPYGLAPTGYLWIDPSSGNLKANSTNAAEGIYTGTQLFAEDLTRSVHPHPIKGVAVAGSFRITDTIDDAAVSFSTFTSDDGYHTHTLDPKIADTLSPYAIQVWIDGGTGEFINRTAEMLDLSGNKQADAPGFTGSFEFECSRFIDAPGRTVRLKFVSIAGGGNPFGLGCLGISATVAASYGGLGQVIRQQQ